MRQGKSSGKGETSRLVPKTVNSRPRPRPRQWGSRPRPRPRQ